MTDNFLQEVDEEVRREQLKKLWERYNILIIGLAVAIVAAVAGWRYYETVQNRRAADAGAAYDAAAKLSEDGKRADAEAAFAKVAADTQSGYRVLAKMREAQETAARDVNAAVALYDGVSVDAGATKPIQDMAVMRAGLLLVDTAPFADMAKRLEPLAVSDGAYRHSARELLALSAWKNGDIAKTRQWADTAIADPEMPPGIRARIDVLLSLVTDQSAKS